MPRYIDADKLKETITDNFLNPYERSHIHDLIDIQPTADVQEVKHGKWIDTKQGGIHGDTIYRCSVCGNEREAYIDEENYCPHCGAKMDDDDRYCDIRY